MSTHKHLTSIHTPVRLLLILTVIAIAALVGLKTQKTKGLQDIQTALIACNDQEQALRYSCYRAVIETSFQGDLESYINTLGSVNTQIFSSSDNTYAIFGTNCHTYYHALGDYIASSLQPHQVQDAINLCPMGCTQGCVMGVSKRMSLRNDYSDEYFQTFYDACREEEKHHCAHEIGHNLTDKYSTSSLQVIDTLTEQTYGVDTKESSYTHGDSASNINQAFIDCKRILPANELSYCHTGIGHNLYLFSEFSPDGYESQIESCRQTDESHRHDCLSFFLLRIGINEAAPAFLSHNYQQAIDICEDVHGLTQDPDLADRCFLGLGGGLGFFVEERYDDDVFFEKSLATIKEELLDIAGLCRHAPQEYQDACYTGLLNTSYRILYTDLYLTDENIDYQLEYNSQLVSSSDASLFPD